MTAALSIERQRIPTMTNVLFRYCLRPGLASLSQPAKRAYVVKIDPRLPSPETSAEAAATPTSPCRGWKISLVHVMVIGTVGPSPNPTSKRPPYRGHGLATLPAYVVISNPAI